MIHGLPPFLFNTLIEKIIPDMEERSKVNILGRMNMNVHCLTFCKNEANMVNSKEETVDKPHEI